MRLALAIAIFALNIFALLSLWQRIHERRPRLWWTAAIVLLPVIGAALWLRSARRIDRDHAHLTWD